MLRLAIALALVGCSHDHVVTCQEGEPCECTGDCVEVLCNVVVCNRDCP